jgi:hypothetical protein
LGSRNSGESRRLSVIDNYHTLVYGRTWHRLPVPGINWLMDAATRFSQYLVFRED